MNNDEKIRELLEAEEIPEEISPENIKAMLDARASGAAADRSADVTADEAAAKKRRGISVGGRIAAAAAACALIAGGGAALKNSDMLRSNHKDADVTSSVPAPEDEDYNIPKGEEVKTPSKSGESKSKGEGRTVSEKSEAYMSGASSYKEIYTLYEKSNKKYQKNLRKSYRGGLGITNEVSSADEAIADDSFIEYENAESMDLSAEPAVGGGDDTHEAFSDTYEQEKGVKEADIIKTDGKNIYTLFNYDNYSDDNDDYFYFIGNDQKAYLNIAPVDKGDIGDVTHICINDDVGNVFGEQYFQSLSAQDMYLYNDLIAVVGTAYGSPVVSGNDEEWHYGYNTRNTVFVSFYTSADTPEYLGTYFQEGYYNDIRITPDGFMYLISDYTSANFDSIEDADNTERYIPCCGTDEKGISCIKPDCILLPGDDLSEDYLLRYSVIGSIDLSTPGTYSVCQTKALADFAGTIYCSPDNLYTADGYDETEITRIAIGGGKIEPAASCRLQGYILDQFSMSEHGGYFRVATSDNTWVRRGNIITDVLGWSEDDEWIRNNHVYVLDMDLNIVGSISDFGLDENIKSVNFSGDIAYVVTYEQTDPLFAIDLSDPAAPKIMDELKLPGYSTYMQKWDDSHLLGFGVNANEDGVETGIKAVMFDNSDPYDLKEVGFYSINKPSEYSWVSSTGVWEHKALLIAPEKNLFGFPVTISEWSDESYTSKCTSKYVFLSYDGSQFVYKGEISASSGREQYSDFLSFERALYIGDYIYTVSGDKIIAAAIDDISITDTAVLNPFNN